MSSESLSQREIDLLFGSVSASSDRDGPARGGQTEVQVYDFRRPSRISKDRKLTLETLYTLLTKSLETWLVGRIRSQVEVQLLGVEQYAFGEFVLSLSSPCTSYIFDIGDSGGEQGLIDVGRDFAFFMVDRLLGGNGVIEVPDRALTTMERMVVRTAAERLIELLTEIWQEHVPLDLELTRFETVPDMIQISNREDPVLVANIGISSEQFQSLILICLPFTVLEKFFTGSPVRRVSRAPGGDLERDADRLAAEQALRATEVEISARLPTIQLTMKELAALRPGRVLETGLPVDSELELLVSGRQRYRAVAGRVGRGLAVQVSAVVNEKTATASAQALEDGVDSAEEG